MSIQITRLRFSFWLDIARDDQYAVAEQVQVLKRERKFTKTIRDGIRLICDLRAGKLDVLFELFPWVKAEFIAGVVGKTDSDPSSSGKLQRELEQIKELLLRNTTPPIVAAPAMAHTLAAVTGTGPKPLDTPKFDLPHFDGDDDGETLVLTKDTRTDSAANFLNSMRAIAQ